MRIPRQTYLSLSGKIMESTRQYCTGKIYFQFVGKNTDGSVERMEVFDLDWKKHQYIIFTQLNFVTNSQVDQNCLIRWSLGLCGKVVGERH